VGREGEKVNRGTSLERDFLVGSAERKGGKVTTEKMKGRLAAAGWNQGGKSPVQSQKRGEEGIALQAANSEKKEGGPYNALSGWCLNCSRRTIDSRPKTKGGKGK